MIRMFNFPYSVPFSNFICSYVAAMEIHFHLLINDAEQRVFLGRLLVARQRAGCVVCWL